MSLQSAHRDGVAILQKKKKTFTWQWKEVYICFAATNGIWCRGRIVAVICVGFYLHLPPHEFPQFLELSHIIGIKAPYPFRHVMFLDIYKSKHFEAVFSPSKTPTNPMQINRCFTLLIRAQSILICKYINGIFLSALKMTSMSTLKYTSLIFELNLNNNV